MKTFYVTYRETNSEMRRTLELVGNDISLIDIQYWLNADDHHDATVVVLEDGLPRSQSIIALGCSENDKSKIQVRNGNENESTNVSTKIGLPDLPQAMVEAGYERIAYKRLYNAVINLEIPGEKQRSRWVVDRADLPVIADIFNLHRLPQDQSDLIDD